MVVGYIDYFPLIILKIWICGSGFLLLLLLSLKFFILFKYSFQKLQSKTSSITVGFFHPYCNAGGGGERVLWCAIRSIQSKFPKVHCIVYTGDVDATIETITKKANDTFGITFSKQVDFKFLYTRSLVEAKRYPVLTLLGQSVGSMVLGIEALLKCPPDVYIDTMGYAFTMPIFKYLGGSRTGCYVHYPTISTDMLSVVENQNQAFNNRPIIAKSKTLTSFKLYYYRMFAWIYGVCGRCSEVVMVNSSWTSNHIKYLWRKENIQKTFPPCDIHGFLQFSLDERFRSSKKIILSIGQFRPEKNHSMQVKVFHNYLSSMDEAERENCHLVMAGGCRNPGDEKRVSELKKLCKKLEIVDNVQIKTNISFSELKSLLQQADVGIHTMANEHFGIGVVEFQAAGVIALAHKSGGPLMDIVQEKEGDDVTGFLADTVESYSKCLQMIFNMSRNDKISIARASRLACQRFSEREFEDGFLHAIDDLMNVAKKQQ